MFAISTRLNILGNFVQTTLAIVISYRIDKNSNERTSYSDQNDNTPHDFIADLLKHGKSKISITLWRKMDSCRHGDFAFELKSKVLASSANSGSHPPCMG